MCNNNSIEKKIKIILIGPVTNVSTGFIGGATISFDYLINYLDRTKESYILVNTQKYRGLKRYFTPFYILVNVLWNAFSADVLFLNSSSGGAKYLAPLLFVFAKVFQLKFVFRPFGGNIMDYAAKYGGFQQWLFRKTVLKSDILFLQTKELMQFYERQNANTIQLPSSRETPSPNLLSRKKPFNKRFIYLGLINKFKGIDHIVEASQQLGKEYIIHVFGPIRDQQYQQKFEENPGIYQGILAKEDVLKTLINYDVLLLPTFYEGEGYPGSIIEAYSLGLPVITTNWKAIPEIVIPKKTGLLISPKSTEELVKAIQHFDINNYKEYSEQASKYFKTSFSSDHVTGSAMEQIKNLFKLN